MDRLMTNIKGLAAWGALLHPVFASLEGVTHLDTELLKTGPARKKLHSYPYYSAYILLYQQKANRNPPCLNPHYQVVNIMSGPHPPVREAASRQDSSLMSHFRVSV